MLQYTGEIDDEDKASGKGVAVIDEVKYVGLFYKDQIHGNCE